MAKRPLARRCLLWLLISALFLAACGGNAPEATPLAATKAATVTEEPTDQPTVQPTYTPVPEPTATVSPTATPSPIPEPTEDAEVSIVAYKDENHGVAFAYPDNWYIQANENAVFVFSDESISRVTSYEEGAALFISTDSRLADLDAEAILDLFVGQLNLVSDQEAIAEPATLTINDQEAAQAAYVGNVEDVPVIVTYTAITNDQIGAVVISVMLQADEEIFGDTLADITNSITLTSLPDPADDERETVFPLPDDVQNLIEEQTAGEDGQSQINYETGLSLEEVVVFYRQEFTARGLVEREVATVIDDTTFSLVFDDPENGRAIVIQGVVLADVVNVNVRFEDN